jgi:hypothetical protein
MRAEQFVKYYFPSGFFQQFYEYQHEIAKLLNILSFEGDFTASASGVTWTCLDEELQRFSFDEIESGLGLFHLLPGIKLVAIAYTIDSSELHVPTILDAGLQPGFVPKAKPHEDLPRAWDWKHCRWGLTEMVHRSGTSIRDPEFRLLGTTSLEFIPNYNALLDFKPSHSAALEEIVAQILRQAFAHNQLESFLSGQTEILEISPKEFELFVALLYARKGYRTKVTKASRDGGFDVIAFADSHHEQGLLIQAKHTRKTVGISIIRELIGARFLAEDELNSYMLVVATTGKFSKPAKITEEQNPALIRLIDYDKLQKELRMIRNIGLTDIAQKAVSQTRTAGYLTRD